MYHIGGDVELANKDLTSRLLEACGAGWESVDYVEDRKGHDRRYSLDDSALRELGYAPRISFIEGLDETVRWYEQNRSWWQPLKAGSAQPVKKTLTRCRSG